MKNFLDFVISIGFYTILTDIITNFYTVSLGCVHAVYLLTYTIKLCVNTRIDCSS